MLEEGEKGKEGRGERLKKGDGKASEQGGRICSRGERAILDGGGGKFSVVREKVQK